MDYDKLSDSWLRTFEGFLEVQRNKEVTVRTKKHGLAIPPGQSIVSTNSDDEDEISDSDIMIEPNPGSSKTK